MSAGWGGCRGGEVWFAKAAGKVSTLGLRDWDPALPGRGLL
jgi:hypothetical protein